jgi:hypothetical protein
LPQAQLGRVFEQDAVSSSACDVSPHAAISVLLVVPPIFTAMPNADDEDVAAFIGRMNDDVRLDRMNAHGRRDLRTLTGCLWIFRQELKRPLRQVVIAIRLLDVEPFRW